MSHEQYDNIAEQYSQMLNPIKKYVLIPTFKKIAGEISGKSVLDLGCGDGFFTRILAGKRPAKAMGVDISEELIKKAVEKEKQAPLRIRYLREDVLKLSLGQAFDVVTAVYLLNYSRSHDELHQMCKAVYNHLAQKGRLYAITPCPGFKPMKDFEYERRYTNVNGKAYFEDGDQIKCEIRENRKKPFYFVNYYWSKETYEACLTRAGFKSIKWVEPIISKEGIGLYGKEYWEKFRKNPSPIGIICLK